MNECAAYVQNCNEEFVKCFENLRRHQERLKSKISKNQMEKVRLQNEITKLTDDLERTNRQLSSYTKQYDECGTIIKETEEGYQKILESTKVLVSLVKQKTQLLDQEIGSEYED